jgi:TolA-binding protein
MREIDEEIREIKKEIIESRGLMIKTNNIANTLGADIKAIAKRQAAHERRTFWNSVAAYGLLAAACLFGFRLLLDASVREIELEKENLGQEVKRLRTALDKEVQRAEKRLSAETRAAQWLELVQAERRADAIARYRELEKEQLSPAERLLFRDIVKRFEAELSAETYQSGVELARAGRLNEAAERLAAAIRIEPNGAYAARSRYQLADTLRLLGKYPEARLEVERVLEQSADRDVHAPATLLYARILEELGDKEGARAQVRKLLAKWPHTSVLLEARQLLSALNEKLGQK